MKFFLYIISALFLFASCQPENQPKEEKTVDITPPNTQPKNVILLIGDGMGLTQVSSTYFFGTNREPSFSRFPVIGLHKTSSAREKITDSAAGATAFASGIKTYNGAIGKDTLKQNIETILERITPKIHCGLIATSSITHATPACFYAHADYRKEEELIAEQLVQSNVDFFAAGGLQFFTKRNDKQNLLVELEKNGFELDTNQLTKAALNPNKKYGYLLAENGLPSKLNGRKDFLNTATEMSLSYFSEKEAPFFLMIEGSQIDWESHATNKEGVIAEMNDFDDVIHTVMDFAEKNGETLVIVTADHETGGFALSPKWEEDHWNYAEIEGRFYDDAKKENYEAGHTATLIPVFAFGPGAVTFSGIYENTEIYHKILKSASW